MHYNYFLKYHNSQIHIDYVCVHTLEDVVSGLRTNFQSDALVLSGILLSTFLQLFNIKNFLFLSIKQQYSPGIQIILKQTVLLIKKMLIITCTMIHLPTCNVSFFFLSCSVKQFVSGLAKKVSYHVTTKMIVEVKIDAYLLSFKTKSPKFEIFCVDTVINKVISHYVSVYFI